jgi:hypothetical protein
MKEYFEATQTEINPSINYVKSNQTSLDLLLKFHNDKSLTDITRKDLISYLNSLKKSEGPPGTSSEPPTGMLSVVIEQVCRPDGVPSPNPEFCDELILPPTSDFVIHVLSGNPTELFTGSSDEVGETGAYEVILLSVPEQRKRKGWEGTLHIEFF